MRRFYAGTAAHTSACEPAPVPIPATPCTAPLGLAWPVLLCLTSHGLTSACLTVTWCALLCLLQAELVSRLQELVKTKADRRIVYQQKEDGGAQGASA